MIFAWHVLYVYNISIWKNTTLPIFQVQRIFSYTYTHIRITSFAPSNVVSVIWAEVVNVFIFVSPMILPHPTTKFATSCHQVHLAGMLWWWVQEQWTIWKTYIAAYKTDPVLGTPWSSFFSVALLGWLFYGRWYTICLFEAISWSHDLFLKVVFFYRLNQH